MTTKNTQENDVVDVITEMVLTYCGDTAVERFAKRGRRSKQSLREAVRRATSNLLTRASLYKRG